MKTDKLSKGEELICSLSDVTRKWCKEKVLMKGGSVGKVQEEFETATESAKSYILKLEKQIKRFG